MQHVLQTGLLSGMSATAGIHQKKPNPVSKEFDGLAAVMPENWQPTSDTRITYKEKNGDVQAPVMSIGAWPWGDTATFHWSPKSTVPSKKAGNMFAQRGQLH